MVLPKMRYCAPVGFLLKRMDEPNTDGIGSHYRYYLANKEDAQKVVNLILSYENSLLTESDISQILALYPSKAA